MSAADAASVDARADAPVNAPVNAPVDAPVDARVDAPVDARVDAPVEATVPLARRLVAEGIGTALLIAVVIGSGLRAERLAAGNVALALLVNSLASGAGLAALLLAFGGMSGGHLNPAVTLSAWLRGMLPAREALRYVAVQLVGAIAGVVAVHLMFGEPLLAWSEQARTGAPLWWSEFLATFGLIGVAMGTAHARPALLPFAVAGYIAAGYWFTASTSFANPALTLACALTATFTGIRAIDVPGFVLAQCAGALTATLVFHWLLRPAPRRSATRTGAGCAAASAAASAADRAEISPVRGPVRRPVSGAVDGRIGSPASSAAPTSAD
ncbi:aquaporin family protein [Cupriavidus cauae]|uniref:Aquaporin family protein n=1 Tax=Cupriavidus cauae TaxID=2608999 RepID=A0A5M8AUH0_9BURK|nr:aquaporin family protein [Cupriavidus cauae]